MLKNVLHLRSLSVSRIIPLTAGTGLLVLVLLLGAFTPAAAAPGAAGIFPPVIPLPNGFQPEGIAVGSGTTFYAGSIPTGAIYAGDLRTGEGDLLVQPQPGRAAIGLNFDKRTNSLFVAGGPTGQAYVYDGETGTLLEQYELTPTGDTFINDVIVTREAAYFTNSRQAYIYRLPLGSGGSLPNPSEVEAIPLSGDYTQIAGFNANGITATPDGKWLIIVHSSLGLLYRVDPKTGVAEEIDLGPAEAPVQFGDGLLLAGNTLYVVQNRLNQIAVIELSPQLTSGEIVGYLQDDDFRVPTTIAKFGQYLYAVNARFGTPPTPTTEYEVVQVRK